MLYGEAGDDLLDGGMDGIGDYLSGGTGKDKFRKESKVVGSKVQNIDAAVDFDAALGDLYF